MVMVILRKGCAHFYCAHQSSSSKIPIQGVKMRWYPQQGRWSKKYINLGTIHETVLNQSCRCWNGWSFACEGLAKNLADRPSIFLSTHLSVLLFCLRLFLCLFVTHLSVCPSLCALFCLSVLLSLCLFFCLSVFSFVSLLLVYFLSLCLSFCLYVILSLSLCPNCQFLILSICSFVSFFLYCYQPR